MTENQYLEDTFRMLPSRSFLPTRYTRPNSKKMFKGLTFHGRNATKRLLTYTPSEFSRRVTTTLQRITVSPLLKRLKRSWDENLLRGILRKQLTLSLLLGSLTILLWRQRRTRRKLARLSESSLTIDVELIALRHSIQSLRPTSSSTETSTSSSPSS